MAKPITSPWVRIWPKVIEDKKTKCWIWTGSRHKHGYGWINVGGRKGRNVLIHRLVFRLFKGPIPPGLQIDHVCRNRSCVNPKHLEPVTPLENTKRGKGHGSEICCPVGHPYEGKNLRLDRKRNRRHCREFNRQRDRRRRNSQYWRDYRARRKASGKPVGKKQP